MTSDDHPVQHFEMMLALARHFVGLSVKLLLHEYNNESFCSWWFTFEYNGGKYRMAYDGRDGYLRCDKGWGGGDWQMIGEDTSPENTSEAVISRVLSLIGNLS